MTGRPKPPREQTAWVGALGLGVVILAAVVVLLERLRRSVLGAERGIGAVWATAQRLAQNTQAAHLLGTTRSGGLRLLEEVELHRPSGREGEA